MDVEQHVLSRSGKVVPLAPKTFDLLVQLAQRPGHAFSKQQLISALWPDTIVEEANLSFQISTLRKALSDGEAQWIETIPKHGYRFSADVRTITLGSAVEKETDLASQSAPESANSTPAAIGSVRVAERARNLPLWVGGALLVASSIGLAILLQTRTRDRPGPPMLESPLTAYEGFETEPAFSPDGNQIVYVWNRDGANSDLYVRLIGPFGRCR